MYGWIKLLHIELIIANTNIQKAISLTKKMGINKDYNIL